MSQLQLDSAVEGLLREIAADPQSQLLRVARPGDFEILFDRAPAVTVARAGLTKAERHLVAAHRGELAWLLREACVARFTIDSRSRPWLDQYVSEDKRIEALDSSAWKALAKRGPGRLAVDADPCEALELLGEHALEPDSHRVSITQLAVASFRLQPTDEARIYVGMDLVLQDQLAFSRRVLREVLRGKPSDQMASYALEDLAFSYARVDQFMNACSAVRSSVERWTHRPENFLHWVHYGLRSGSKREVATAAEMLRDNVSRDHPAHRLLLKRLRSQRESGFLEADAKTKAFIQSIKDTLPSIARDIADVLH